MRKLKSHGAKKSEGRDPLGYFNILSAAKYQKTRGPFGETKKIEVSQSRKGWSLIMPKSGNLLLRKACKQISTYAPVRTRTFWVEKQASYHHLTTNT